MTIRKRGTWILRWAVSAGLLGWILTRVEFGRFLAEVPHLDVFWLLGGLACAGLSLALGAWRWQACLRALGMEVGFWSLFKITLAATAAGCVSFGSLGVDLAKVVLAGRYLPGRRGGVLSSLVLDHVSALPWMVVMILLVVVQAHGAAPELDTSGAWVAVGVAVGVAAVGVVVGLRFKSLYGKMMRVLGDRATWHGLVIAGFRSVPMWLAYCGIFYCAARAFGVVVPAAGFAGVVVVAGGVASLPVTIAGIRVREEAVRGVLGDWYGVPSASAVAVSLTGFSLSLVWAAAGAFGFAGGSVKTANIAIS
ncbi:MAG: flippase-like domain-containing protein [Akkermansiaceae bacterium]|nr:flippase-like domain-containing protein [Akkermansiaceae bacterium]